MRTWFSGSLTFKVACNLKPQSFTFLEQQDKGLVMELGGLYFGKEVRAHRAQWASGMRLPILPACILSLTNSHCLGFLKLNIQI